MFDLIAYALPLLLKGALITAEIAILGIILGTLLGMLLVILRLSNIKIIQALVTVYDITAETCGHYLSMTSKDVVEKGPLYKCAPCLRTQEQVDRLWDYVKDGTICGIASDHSPCSYDEKFKEIFGKKIETPFDVWGGISSIQSVFQVVFHEGITKRKMSPSVLAKTMSENPAKAFGLYGKKGAILPGFDADLVLVNPDMPWEITKESLAYVNKLSAFVGKKGFGKSVMTIIRGEVVVKDDSVLVDSGFGKLIRNKNVS